MCTEVLAKDGVVGLANLAVLMCIFKFYCAVQNAGYATTNLRSLVNAKRSTESMRMKGSSESLILPDPPVNGVSKRSIGV